MLGGTLARTLENFQGKNNSEAAAQLWQLYEVGRDFGLALRECSQAALNAVNFAHREAIELARRGLHLLEGLPDTPECEALELPLQTMLGLQLQVTRGYAAPDATRAYRRVKSAARTSVPHRYSPSCGDCGWPPRSARNCPSGSSPTNCTPWPDS